MKLKINYKLMRKYLILIVMIVGLVFVASSNKFTTRVAAAPCCESCTPEGDPTNIYQWCGGQCWVIGTLIPGNYAACVNNCERDALGCYSSCVYCSGGGAPGGECNSDGQCNYNEFCGADNYCHYW